MNDDIRKSVIIGFILAVIITGVITYNIPSNKQEESVYNSETYKDEEIIYKIITDRAGDVIYCEPMEK